MNKVRLIARPNTWFKAGTEVFHYDENRRITLDEWNQAKKEGFGILCSGIRICENPKSENKLLAEEYDDSELCSIDEFDVEILGDEN